MSALPEGPLGKILALALTALPLAALYAAVVTPLTSLYAAEESKLQDRETLARHIRAAAQVLPNLRLAAKDWQARSDKEPLLLGGANDIAAAATLQSALKDVIETDGAKLSSSEILPSEPQGGFRRIGLRVAFSGDTDLLARVLRSVETAHPVLAVRSLDIHDSGNASDGEALSITLDVYGFRSR